MMTAMAITSHWVPVAHDPQCPGPISAAVSRYIRMTSDSAAVRRHDQGAGKLNFDPKQTAWMKMGKRKKWLHGACYLFCVGQFMSAQCKNNHAGLLQCQTTVFFKSRGVAYLKLNINRSARSQRHGNACDGAIVA
jgi:hypothetical protein